MFDRIVFRKFPGPIVAEAMFLNREEIPVFPLYRDPVSDPTAGLGLTCSCLK